MKKNIVIIINIVLVLLFNLSLVYGASLSDIYNPISNGTGDNALFKATSIILGWLKYGTIIISVIVLMIKGIKFIMAAPEGKADVKKELVMWTIGLVILFSLEIVVEFIIKQVNPLNEQIGNII